MLSFLLVALFFLISPFTVHAQWTHLSGPTPPPASELTRHGNLWFLGTEIADAGDLFVSEDEGHTWSDVGLPNGGVSALYSHQNVLYVGLYLDGLRRSEDNGNTWTEHLQSGAPTVRVVKSMGGQTLFAGLDPFHPAKLQRSDNNGLTWAQIETGPSLRCFDLALVDGVILAAGEDAGIHRSEDGGLTWGDGSAGLPLGADTHHFVVRGDTVLVAAETVFDPLEIYQSVDLGQSWSQISLDLPSPRGNVVPHFSDHQGALLLGINGTSGHRGLFRSLDGGIHWTHLSAGVPDHPGVFVADVLDGDLVVGTQDGVFRSANDGATWEPSWQGATGIGGGSGTIYAFEKLFVSVGAMGSLTDGIYATDDQGFSWSPAVVPPVNCQSTDFARDDDVLYATLYGADRGVAASFDGGATFNLTDPDWSNSSVLTCIHVHEGVVLAGSWEGIYRSGDGGENWSLNSGTGVVFDLVSHDGAVFAGLYPGGVLRSVNAGLTWSPVNTGLDPNTRINSLAVFDGTVFAASNNGTVFRWDGAGWVDTGYDSGIVYTLVAAAGNLVAGTAYGEVYRTEDGVEWQGFSSGFTDGAIEGSCVTPDQLVLITRHRGIWSRPLTDLGGVSAVEENLPTAGLQLEVSPNPFNPLIILSFYVPQSGPTVIHIHDLAGRRVKTLLNRTLEAGTHTVRWNGRDDDGRSASAGVYLVRVTTGEEKAVKKITLVR